MPVAPHVDGEGVVAKADHRAERYITVRFHFEAGQPDSRDVGERAARD